MNCSQETLLYLYAGSNKYEVNMKLSHFFLSQYSGHFNIEKGFQSRS